MIGCGKIAQVRHIPEYESNPDARLVGLYDRNSERSQALAGELDVTRFDSVDALLSHEGIDAVSVCTPNESHFEISMAALQKGKHVLCEKPMAITMKECRALVDAAKNAGKILAVGHNQRLMPAHVEAKKQLAKGAIGKVLTFRTTFGHGGAEAWSIDPGKSSWFLQKSRAAMGVMADLGVHKIDLLQFLLDDDIAEVTARLVTVDKRDAGGQLVDVDDNAFCILKMAGGATGTMTASWTCYSGLENGTVLYGTKGTMRILEQPGAPIQLKLIGRTEETIQAPEVLLASGKPSSGVIDEFVRSIIHSTQPGISGESALSAMGAVFACIESSGRGKTIAIKRECEKDR